MAEIAKADEWGLLRFVPHERLDVGLGETWGWVPDIEPLDDPDAWHPLDLLIAPLHDDEGELRGTLAIDLPDDGRRPGEAQRARAAEVRRAGRPRGRHRAGARGARRAGAAGRGRPHDRPQRQRRSVQPRSGSSPTASDALVEGFRAHGMWIQTFDEDGPGTGAIYSADGTDRVAARGPGRDRRARPPAGPGRPDRRDRLAATRPFGPTIDQRRRATRILAFLDGPSASSSMLFVPLGAGPECLGNLVLTRLRGAPEWTEVEATAALDIGHDLGRAILNARAFEREHQLVAGAPGARHLQEPADRHRLPRAEEPAHLDRGPPRDAGEPPRRAGLDPQLAGRDGPGLAAPGPGGRGPAAALQGRRPAQPGHRRPGGPAPDRSTTSST